MRTVGGEEDAEALQTARTLASLAGRTRRPPLHRHGTFYTLRFPRYFSVGRSIKPLIGLTQDRFMQINPEMGVRSVMWTVGSESDTRRYMRCRVRRPCVFCKGGYDAACARVAGHAQWLPPVALAAAGVRGSRPSQTGAKDGAPGSLEPRWRLAFPSSGRVADLCDYFLVRISKPWVPSPCAFCKGG
jgi:hypothetical protein